ncbi:MFS family permease [Crossiella equi]|uniref:MFS family permease n=1 Tax=Crossiella equi TaxID=130796 RepID=A0ABS5AL02_9PSEU|nr:MFS transporter [Crossiella equi]MBP2476904.1 MFS family permease [Crossiella equi]
MTPPTTARAPSTLWTPEHRAVTTGLVLLVTLAAFEAMGLGTALPTIIADLDGASLYSWPFTAFLAASVVGNVLAGRVADRKGPAFGILAGPALFLAGLLVAGTADSMVQLLVGRALQGLGAGTQIVSLYVLVALVYPERGRPAVFGAISAAWVVPALVGPTVAGLLVQYLDWRWVFLGLAPFVLLGILLLGPTVKSLRARAFEVEPGAPRKWLPLAAVAAGVGVPALTWASQHPSLFSIGLAAVGLGLLVPALGQLLPKGTFRAARGLPVTVLVRGLLSGAFFAVESYVPLTLSSVHHYSPAMAGIPLTLGAIGWAAASMWQGRHPDLPRHVLMRRGLVLVSFALAGLVFVAPSWGPSWLAVPLWLLAGSGMGLAMSSTSVVVLGLSEPGDRGFNSSALQLADLLTQAVCVGIGGVLLNLLGSTANPTTAVIVLNSLMAGVAAMGAVLASRATLKRP